MSGESGCGAAAADAGTAEGFFVRAVRGGLSAAAKWSARAGDAARRERALGLDTPADADGGATAAEVSLRLGGTVVSRNDGWVF